MTENDNQDRVLIVGPAGKLNILRYRLGHYLSRGYKEVVAKEAPKKSPAKKKDSEE